MLDDDMRRRRIRVRAWRRGMREMDILLGRFVDARVEALPSETLDELETLLDLPDDEVFRWLTGAEQPPAEHDTPVLRQIIAFHRHDGPIH